MLAERNDLRLELTLEERRRRFQAARLSAEQSDATDGVAFFERNMTRLGLDGPSSSAGSEPPLRAVPATDPGPMAHLHALEQRVESLQFRPSNNLQMMKELRARRKAQLAAEKDRRIRRMKAMKDATPPPSSASTACARTPMNAPQSKNHEVYDDDIDASDDDDDEQRRQETSTESSAHELFLSAKREELEANYARLHDIGVERRERDLEILSAIRERRRLRSAADHEAACRDIIASLASFAMTLSEQRLTLDSPEYLALRQSCWLAPSQVTDATSEDNERVLETRDLVHQFMALTGVWTPHAPLGIDRSLVLELDRRLETFATRVAALSSDCDALQWPSNERPQSLSPLIVAVFTSDERSAQLTRAFAAAQSLLFLNIDELVDESIQHSYDPQKQSEHAASLGPREVRANSTCHGGLGYLIDASVIAAACAWGVWASIADAATEELTCVRRHGSGACGRCHATREAEHGERTSQRIVRRMSSAQLSQVCTCSRPGDRQLERADPCVCCVCAI
ncbi:hypothetical protein PINS_up008637 [Pythium insidiosum]|nr:hypothetical protein PINS_up008637 [Pythium insidiosum]